MNWTCPKILISRILIILCLFMMGEITANESDNKKPATTKTKLDLYLLIGARNMCGQARYDRADMDVVPRTFLLNRKDQWEPAAGPMNRYASIITKLSTQKLNPGYTFAKAMTEKNPSAYIGLICNAKDKSSIKEWAKDSLFYKEAIRRTKAAQKSGVLKGILWHQGESDLRNTQHLEKLKALIANFRNDFEVPTLPFIVGELYQAKSFNAQLATLPAAVAHTGIASSEGLKQWRPLAFDTAGVKIIGQRYAEALLKIQGAKAMAETGYGPPVIPTPPTYSGPKENLHVYLLIGQSNMAGRAPYSVEDGKPLDGTWLLNQKNQWEQASLPFNRYCSIVKRLDTSGLNPGYGFAKTLRKSNPKISIGLISNARGSTSIKQWGKGSNYYKAAMLRLKAAMKTGTLKGILWHQGESDERDTKYIDKLKAMIEAWRKDLSRPNLPFVVGQINNDSKGRGALINSQVIKLPALLPFTACVSSKDLSAKDLWHFDNKGMKILGQRYGEAMLKLGK